MAQKTLTVTEGSKAFNTKWEALSGPIWPVTNKTLKKKFYFRTKAQAEAYALEFNSALATEENGLIDTFDIRAGETMVVNDLTYDSYILSGTTGSKIRFTWHTLDSTDARINEPVLITYKFENSDGSQTIQGLADQNTEASLTVDRYLAEGKNTITMTVLGRSTGASTVKIITINVIALKLTSTFKVSKTHTPNTTFKVGYTVKSTYDVTVEAYIDGVCVSRPNVTAAESGIEKNLTIVNTDLTDSQKDSGKHHLQLRAYIQIEGMSENFYSPIYYYEYINTGAGIKAVSLAYVISDGKNGLMTSRDTTGSLLLKAEQYVPTSWAWGFYFSSVSSSSVDVVWRLAPFTEGGSPTDEDIIPLRTFPVQVTNNDEAPDDLKYPFTEVGTYWLQAVVNNEVIGSYKLQVIKNTSNIAESDGADVRLLAVGRSNGELATERVKWEYTSKSNVKVTTQFNNVPFNNSCGWNKDEDKNDALRLTAGSTAIIKHKPLAKHPTYDVPTQSGRTIEITFKTFNVTDENTPVIQIGDMIKVYPTSAVMKTSKSLSPSTKTTEYNKNQKITLTFVITPTDIETYVDGRIFYMTANGCIEKTNAYTSSENFTDNESYIQCGDPTGKNGVYIYSVCVYPTYLPLTNNFYNYVVKSEDISSLVTDNDIFVDGNIDYDKVAAKMPTMLFQGNFDKIINTHDKERSFMDKAIWKNPWHPTLNFEATHVLIGRHGQSTLIFPIPSVKFWLDKEGSNTIVTDYAGNTIRKGRWAQKDEEGCMPLKKYVLQAYYIDSTCYKSPALLGLMNDAFYNCTVNGEHVLRTPPQRYATEQYQKDMARIHGGNESDYVFPYKIRIAPDSQPCSLWWQKDESSPKQFVGMAVLMDDKKSEFLYGERSIYDKVLTDGTLDPFDFYEGKKGNVLFDNKDVVRWEGLKNTGSISLFRGATRAQFYANPSEIYLYYKWNESETSFVETDSEADIADAITTTYADLDAMEEAVGNETFTPEDGKVYAIKETVSSTDTDMTAKWTWEQYKEMIYPDLGDDIHIDGTADNIKYLAAADVICELDVWLNSCYQDYLNTGNYNKLYKEIDGHIDLYFLAGNYKIKMDNGLFDNMFRNINMITWGLDCDGNRSKESGKPRVWYELPWDYDTAYGSINSGVYAFQPPVNRQSKDYHGWAFSCHDSFLYNAMEAWTENVTSTMTGKINNFKTILRQVSQGMSETYSFTTLYNKQLSEYGNKWPEQMYNQSMWRKYCQEFFSNRKSKSSYLNYQMGNGKLFLAWWMRKNMTNWNAQICCGDYVSTRVYCRINEVRNVSMDIKLTFAEDNYFAWGYTDSGRLQQSGVVVTNDTVAKVHATEGQLSDPFVLFGCQSVKYADFSEFARYIETLEIGAFYDDVMGTNLVKLNIGVPKEVMKNASITSYRYNVCTNFSGWDKLTQIEELNIQGWSKYFDQNAADFSMLTLLKDFYAAGAVITQDLTLPSGISDFYCELPAEMPSLTMDGISFRTMPSGQHACKFIDKDTMEEVSVPYTLKSIHFSNMGRDNAEARRIVVEWLRSIKQAVAEGKATYNEYSIRMGGVYWTDFSYDDLYTLAQISGERIIDKSSYIKISGAFTSEQVNIMKGYFADNVFEVNNGVLTLDCSVSTFIINIDGDDVYTKDGNICIKEGNGCTLSGFAFPMTDDMGTPSFYDAEVGVGQAEYTVGTLRFTNKGVVTTEEQGSDDYAVTIYGQARANGSYVTGHVTIHVIKRTYPSSARIKDTNALTLDNQGRLVINNMGHYKFSREFLDAASNVLNTFDGSLIDTNATGWIWEDSSAIRDHTTGEGYNKKKDFCVWVQQLTDTEVVKTLQYWAKFKNGQTYTSKQIVMVIYQVITELLISDTGLGGNKALYDFLVSIGVTPTRAEEGGQYGYYSTADLKKVGLNTSMKLDLTDNQTVTSFLTKLFNDSEGVYDTYNTLKYMTNVLQLVLDGSNIAELDLSPMTWLTDISMKGCTEYEGDLDITSNESIIMVDVSGSSVVNVTGIENKSNIRAVKFNAPTEISFVDCPNFTLGDIEEIPTGECKLTDLALTYDDEKITVIYNVLCPDEQKGVIFSTDNSDVTVSKSGSIQVSETVDADVNVTATSTYDTNISSTITIHVRRIIIEA